MSTPRTPNQKKQYAALNARLNKYTKLIEQLYTKYNREAAAIALRTDYLPDDGKMFRFKDYPQTRAAINDLLLEYANDIVGTIHRSTAYEWQQSNTFQDLLANKVLHAYGISNPKTKEYQHYFQTNSDQLKAFQQRQISGMNLSQRVWDLRSQYKEELEMALSVGIEQGISANALASQMKKYLNDPDKLFRRVRDEFGNLQLSKNAKAYHPGRGVYRSSFKNAQRLTRSEINMAYRTAEQTRWRQFDFVVGYEIKLSQRHPCHDVCDELAGRYPKDFVWTGWHPNDMCYAVSILKTDEEFWRDLAQDPDEPKEPSVNEVSEVPDGFKEWIADNADRIEAAEKRGTQPYFIRDNREAVDEVLKPREDEDNIKPHYGAAMKLGRSATKEAMKIVENIGAPELSEVQKQNIRELADALGMSRKDIKPMSFLGADQGASNPMKDSENCQSVVVAFEARRRGIDCYALPYSSKANSASYALGERFQDAWINPKTGKVIEPTVIKGKSDEDIISKLKKQVSADGRYVLGINENNGRGHVVSIEKINGKILIKDEQNDDFISIDSLERISYLEILKVDKAILNISRIKSILKLS